eukprot:scpid73524/ scgid6237/ Homocysteine-responsive endoplasmic reticulum-resident ubiquitin-like domain member 2 protein
MASPDLDIVIRSPTGKENDFSIACHEEWSVKDVKHHISLEYPSKPPVNTQRIIYQGKLLLDDQLIRHVLQPVPGGESADEKARIFFMISSGSSTSAPPSPAVQATSLERGMSCPASPPRRDPLSAVSSTRRSPATPVTPSAATPGQETTGLRYRGPAVTEGTAASPTPSTEESRPAASAAPQQLQEPPPLAATAGMASTDTSSPSSMPYNNWSNPTAWASSAYSAYPSLSADQQAYMSAYYQHYGGGTASYMNHSMWQAYMASAAAAAAAHASTAYQGASPYAYPGGMVQQNPMFAAPPNAGVAPVQQQPVAPAPGPAVAGQPANRQAPAAQRQQERQPPMAAAPGANAGGLLGAVDNDEEDNQQPRLLRFIGAGFRMVLMMSVLYSLCTPVRFTILLVVAAVINLYQAGFFNLRRAAHRRPQAADPDVIEALADFRRRAQNQGRGNQDAAAAAAA